MSFAAPLFAPDRFTVINIAPFSPGSEDQLAKEMVEYRDRTGGDVVLYSLTLHPEGFPAMRKAEYLVESYRKLRRALEGSGIRLGVLVQSILGHWPRVDKDEESWTRSITLEGKQKRFCPIDPGCRAYIHDVARMLAQEKPCFILLDDDVHASGTFGVECFCERHVEMFNKANGTSHTAESLRAAVKGCKPGDAVCDAFQKMQRMFVDDLVDAFRAAVDFQITGRNFNNYICLTWASLIAQLVKNPSAMQGIRAQSLGWEEPEKGMATHSSILAWRIPRAV